MIISVQEWLGKFLVSIGGATEVPSEKSKEDPKPQPTTPPKTSDDWQPSLLMWKGCQLIKVNKKESRMIFVADADCDADGSPRAKTIDPKNGQYMTSLATWAGWKGKGAKDKTDTYVDSESVPYFVLPLKMHEKLGITKPVLGCIARVSWNGKSVYCILADEGPEELIGELSIKALEVLGFNPWNSDKSQVVRGIPKDVTYDVFYAKRDLNRCVDFDSIQAYGREVFGEKQPDGKVYKIFLDPGHSASKPGARSNDGTAKEEELNVLQANIIKRELEASGRFVCTIFNPDPDNLSAVGAAAKGHDMSLHIHHNCYEGASDPGTEVLYDNDKAETQSKDFAKLLSANIAKVLGTTDRGAKPFGGTVMDVAEQQGTFPVVLTESYFLNPYSKAEAEVRSTKAAMAIVDSVKRWFRV